MHALAYFVSVSAGRPDFTYVGCARVPGLDSKYETAPQSHLPETILGELAATFQKRLGDKAWTVVVDPKAKVSRVQLGAGYATPPINNPAIDVVVSGEQQESDGFLDSPAYVLDTVTPGVPKGWIMPGHSVSEEQGMLEMAQRSRRSPLKSRFNSSGHENHSGYREE